MNKPKISIIMPVLNEEKILPSTLDNLKLSNYEELIVVDGGSTDSSMSIAADYTDKVFSTATGRASVMNFGVQKADGEILLFLHADCMLHEDGFDMIRTALSDDRVSAGAFLLSIDSPGKVFRLIESASNIRSKLTSMLYGDQGIFLKKNIFTKIGGYADIPLMEDIEISGRLRKEGKIVFIRPAIKASPRRWLEEGAMYTTLRDWTIAFCYSFLKTSPRKLIRYYREVR